MSLRSDASEGRDGSFAAWPMEIDASCVAPTVAVASDAAQEDGIAKSWEKVIFFAVEKLRIRSQDE